MMPDPVAYQLLLVGLMLLCLMLHIVWPYGHATSGSTTPLSAKAPRQRSRTPKPFPGLLHKPPCAACEQTVQAPEALPPPAPLPIISRRGRPREGDPSHAFSAHRTCAYRGWAGLGRLRPTGPPSG